MIWRLLLLFNYLKHQGFIYRLKRKGVKFGNAIKVQGYLPNIENQGQIVLGDNVRFRGINSRVAFTTTSAQSLLEVGHNCFFNHGVNISASTTITLGDNCRIGDNVIIFDSNFHPVGEGDEVKVAPIHIGKNVWIGANVIVLAGCNIGDHSVIAAGSVVSKNIEPKSLYAGNPATRIRKIHCNDNWVRS